MDNARDLGLAPALLQVQGPDDVGPALAAESDIARLNAPTGPSFNPPAPVICVPPPEKPTGPGLSADSVAVKPPANEAV